jgi:RHS repeat-associated protein
MNIFYFTLAKVSLTKFLKNFFDKKGVLQFFLFFVIAAVTIFDANAQQDTVTVKNSDTTNTGTSASAPSEPTPNRPVPPGCSISGSTSVTGGTVTRYTYTCVDRFIDPTWQVTCGVIIYNGGSVIDVLWNASGCNNGVITTVNSDQSGLTYPVTITAPATQPTPYTPLYNSTNFTKTIDLLKPVGTVAGSAGTTPSGGVSYTIPIYTPPGTNGIEPAISITYNSQAASGVAGWGWNISGLSVINRTGKNIYHNGIVKPVAYTTDDAFLLDGMRLNVITGSNGANGTVYAGEAESFAQIISYTTGSANNPDWFKVIGKDGSTMEFGKTADSRVLTDDGANVMLWRLNRISDINGNYIEFVYENGDRDSRIRIIRYTGNVNTGLSANNFIYFDYKFRTDKNTGYDAGGSLSSQYLLDKILVVTNNNTVTKNYQFNYGFDNINSFLKEVVESSGTGTSLNSTIFLYGDQPQNMTVVPATNTNVLQGVNDLFSGDFDADGKTDIMVADKYYKDGYRFHTKLQGFCDLSNGTPYLLYSQVLPLGNSLNYFSHTAYKSQGGFVVSDYNKDGRDDILVANATVTSISNQFVLELASLRINYSGTTPSSGPDTYFPPQISYPAGNYKYSKSGKYLASGDFDGDGNQDYILTLSQYPTPTVAYNYKNFMSSPATNEFNQEILQTGSLTIDGNASDAFHMGKIAENIIPLDFDGDGKQELLVTSINSSGIVSFNRISGTTGLTFVEEVIYSTTLITNGFKIFPGDFNGDRKTDLLIRNTTGVWYILYSTGKSFINVPFSFNQTVTFNGSNGDNLILIADFNGDGKSDILHGFPVFINNVASTSKLSLYFGRGVSSAPFYYEQYDYNRILPSSPNGIAEGITVGDFNGDGKSDIISKPSTLQNENIDLITFKAFGKEKFLAKVTDGYNATTSFNYKSLTDKSTLPYVYERTVSLTDAINQNPYNYIQLPLYVVSAITVPNGIGGNNTTTFTYENAVVHRAAKGFLGFKKITSKNVITDIISVTENEINTQFAVPYTTKQTTKLISTGASLSESQITTSFVNLSTSSTDKRYLQKADKTLNIDYVNGRASEMVNTYDAFNNVTQSIAKTGTLSGSTLTAAETLTTTASYSIHNTPVAAKPDNVTVSNVRAGQPALSSTTAFTYTPAGLPATQTAFSGLPKAVTTTYTYNSFGNPLTIVTSSAGLTNRTVTNTYDDRGRFALSKQISGNGISQTESYTYDEQWGQPLTHISTDCLTTTFEYDVFGRLKKTTLPQGFSVVSSLNWDLSGNNVWYAFTDYPGGKPDAAIWYDKLGREIKSMSVGFNNQPLTKQAAYNAKGQLSAQTNDYYAAETPLVTTNTYDIYGRLVTAANSLNTITNTYTPLGSGKVQVATSNASGQSSSKISDATGKVITAIDNGGQLDFTFDSRGNQIQVQHGSNVLITSLYDSYGRQTSLTDKNAGTVTYIYNAFGELTQQTDAKGNTYNMLYDGLGRLSSRSGLEGVTSYEYYSVSGCSNNSPVKITGFNGVIKEYTYDVYKRPASEKVTIDGIPLITYFTYDQYGALTKTVYPSGIEENRTYDGNGGLLTVGGTYAGASANLCTVTGVNGFGQATGFTLGNGKTTQHTYNYGIPTRYYTAGVQDLNMVFDYTKGNVLSRRDANKNITESFTYDNLNRLTSATVNTVQQFAMSYDGTTTSSMGNIVTKTDAGNYVYKTDKIHAVAYITNPAGAQVAPANISVTEQQITYTGFLKTAKISEGPNTLDFTYGPDYERVKTVLKNNNAVQETRAYIGNYEIQIAADGTVRELHYIAGADGVCALLVKQGSTITPYFIYTDHLGSLVTITDAAGAVIAEQNFDAWGRKRNPANWQYGSVTDLPILNRGFTGHEHLPQFGLINMNGRMYDPVQGRMLSPDNYVSTPYGTQGYNRYGYALNNPLSITDPDGQFFHIIIGAIIGGVINLGIKAFQGRIGSFSDGLKAFGVGAVAGGLGAATGGASLAVTGLTGASVAGGAVAGIAGSIISSPILGLGNGYFFGDPYSVENFGRDVLIGGAGGAIVGGALAAFKGNNIWLGNPVANGRTIWSFNNQPIGGKFGTVTAESSQYAGWNNADGSFTEEFAGHKIGETASGGIANSRELGILGEEAVGVGSKTRIPSLTGTAKYRIPDILTETTLEEIKNVNHLSLTKQLKDFHLYSQQRGLQMILHTRFSTTFSGPLQNLIDNGSIIIKPILFK